ncbi:hypothetical protein HELRODRAFT_171217 [Helobdella robusta]|uniref:Uncharacterized protein n=1 Tax=Helobdella robusta TaxID=6412 RepID=T1F3Y4_HELRO|nr:hypothetical protein HELRODRAFT_171217 [Helobdella robusta]ESO05573.1 hypothetical protein HELRODRAFT_171217 [Helobdella robusta]
MVLTIQQQKFKLLLEEAITLLCKSSLPYKMEASVEALIGVTLDSSDVFLISIKESFDNKMEDGDLVDGDHSHFSSEKDSVLNVHDESSLIENSYNDDYNEDDGSNVEIIDKTNDAKHQNEDDNEDNDVGDEGIINGESKQDDSTNSQGNKKCPSIYASTKSSRSSGSILTVTGTTAACSNKPDGTISKHANKSGTNVDTFQNKNTNKNDINDNNVKHSNNSSINSNNYINKIDKSSKSSADKLFYSCGDSETPSKKRRRNNDNVNSDHLHDNNVSMNENENYINNQQVQHCSNNNNNVGFGKNNFSKTFIPDEACLQSSKQQQQQQRHQQLKHQQQQKHQQHSENHLNNLTEFICGNLAEIKSEIFDDNLLTSCFNENVSDVNNSNKNQLKLRSTVLSHDRRVSTYQGHNNPHINVKVEKFLSPIDMNSSSNTGNNNSHTTNDACQPPNLNPTQISMATDILNISGAFVNIGSAKAFQHSLRALSKSQLSDVINNMSVPPSNAYSVGLLCTEGVSRVFYKIPPTMIKQEALDFYNLDFYTYNNLYYNSVRVPHNIRDPEDWKALIAMKNPFTYNGAAHS